MRKLAVLLLALALLATPALAQDDGSLYSDPNGRFTVALPTNWTAVTTDDGYGLLTDPDNAISVAVLAVDAGSAQDGITAAWALVDPDFALDPLQTQDVPPPAISGLDEILVITYDTSADPARFVQAFAQRKGGVVYVMLFDITDLTVAQRRAAQLQVIATGLTITDAHTVDFNTLTALPWDDAMAAKLEAFIAEQMAAFSVPGASIAIVQDGQVVYTSGFGTTDSGDPITADTPMMIGSTTKSFTTLLLAILVDEGVITWDTPVVDVLPAFAVADPDLTQTLTLRHLVCACTGVPRRDYELLFNALTPQDVLASLATFEFFTDFGEAFQYSNQMVAAAGFAAGVAAGGSPDDLLAGYVDALQARVLDPLGMGDTTVDLDAVLAGGRQAAPHGMNLFGDYVAIPYDYERFALPVAPSGALWSTAADMAKYMLMQLSTGVAPDGTRIVSADNLNVTREPQVAMSADASYGLGWMIESINGLTLIEHGGNTLGFTSDFAFLPDKGIGVLVMTNGQGTNLFSGEVRKYVFGLLFEQDYDRTTLDYVMGQIADQRATLRANLGDAVDADAVADFVGTYSSDALGSVTITLDDGVLTLDAGEFSSQLLPYMNDDGTLAAYLLVDPPLAGLDVNFRDDGGRQTMLMGEGVALYTFTKDE